MTSFGGCCLGGNPRGSDRNRGAGPGKRLPPLSLASLTRWTWLWAGSGSSRWTGKPGMLCSMGSQRLGHDWATELKCYHAHQLYDNGSDFYYFVKYTCVLCYLWECTDFGIKCVSPHIPILLLYTLPGEPMTSLNLSPHVSVTPLGYLFLLFKVMKRT